MKTANKQAAEKIMTEIYDLKRQINNFSDTGEIKETSQQSNSSDFRHDGFWWFFDARPNPWAEEGEPEWKMFPDHKSVAIDTQFYLWQISGKD